MKKYLFLIAMLGTLISFTACKKEKENYEEMMIGIWELISAEGNSLIANEFYAGHTIIYYLSDFSYYDVSVDSVSFTHGHYNTVKNNTVKITYWLPNNGGSICYDYSVKISFLGTEKMKWQNEAIKYMFKKIGPYPIYM